MRTLNAQLRTILAQYVSLDQYLSHILQCDDPDALIASINAGSENLAAIAQMNARIEQLSAVWISRREELDPRERQETAVLIESVKQQAVRLSGICGMGAARVGAEKDKLEKNLLELGKGSQFLRSVKPVKNNYPKFIDSRC